VLRGKVPLNEVGICMDKGPDYKYAPQPKQQSLAIPDTQLLAELPDGRWLYAR